MPISVRCAGLRGVGVAALAALTLATATTSPAMAHEFWMLPTAFRVAPGGSTALQLNVGEYFGGERVGISQPLIASFRQYAAGSSTDLRDTVPSTGQFGSVEVGLAQAGTHLFAMDTQPSSVALPADKFHAYLHDEGLDHVVKLREAAGTAATPSRERFRRNLKTLVQVGTKTDATSSVRTGQRLELLPLANPYSRRAGQDLPLQVFFDGQPLANALVKAWFKRGGQTLVIRAVTGDDGKTTVSLPWPGTWMISVVHMIPVTDSPEYDWDSFWGNLTFGLP